jgi:hypothetical protein
MTEMQLCVLWTRRFWFADQLLKKRAVMNHGLAQVFGAGLPTCLTKRASVGGAVILENQWMIHRDICGTLFEVTDRIAPSRHHIAEQLVGVGYSASGPVNETRLNSAPGLDKPGTIVRSERSDVQALHSVCAPIEHGFCFPPAAAFFHGARIFSAAKLGAESFGAAFTGEKQKNDACDCQHDNSDEYGYLCRANC